MLCRPIYVSYMLCYFFISFLLCFSHPAGMVWLLQLIPNTGLCDRAFFFILSRFIHGLGSIGQDDFKICWYWMFFMSCLQWMSNWIVCIDCVWYSGTFPPILYEMCLEDIVVTCHLKAVFSKYLNLIWVRWFYVLLIGR